MSKFKKPKNTDFIYDLNFRLYNMSGFGILDNPKKWQNRLYLFYRNTIYSSYLFFICTFIVDAYLVRNDKEKLNLNLCVTILTIGSVIKMWDMMKKLKVVVEIRRKFRENFNLPYVGQGKAHEELLQKFSHQTLQITKALYLIIIPAVTIWVIFPLVDPSSKERKYCVPFPLLKQAPTPIFELMYTLHVFLLMHFVSNIVQNELVFIGFLNRICGQFDILVHNISKIKQVYPSVQFEKFICGYKDEKSDHDDNYNDKPQRENTEINNVKNMEKLKNEKQWRKKETIKMMRQNIVHHRCILQQLNDIEYGYRGTLFVNMTLGGLLLSIVAFDVILQSRKFNAPVIQQLLYVAGVVTDIFVMCYYGTQVKEKSEQVAEALYDIPWHEMDTTSRKIISFMIAKCRRPRSIKAAYVLNLNLETYLAFMKTSYNVIALLNETK